MRIKGLQKILVNGLIAVCMSCSSSDGQWTCHTSKVVGGYGYVIQCKGDTLINQPYIPAISGKQAFRTEREALEVGRLVCRKLSDGLPPALTREEVTTCLRQVAD